MAAGHAKGARMTGWRKRQVVELAREAGFYIDDNEIYSKHTQSDHELTEPLEAFAELVRADEREACAKVAVSMRMPKVGDRVICLEDESLATVVSLTAGGSPDIVFSDGSRGTYLLREFAELFGYATPPALQRTWVGLTRDEQSAVYRNLFNATSRTDSFWVDFANAIEVKLKEKNNG
jgi:hypothetical protein